MSSPHFSVATAIEKNRIASDVAFVLMLEIGVLDQDGTLVETLRICKNSENVIYRGNEFTASNFQVKLNIETGAEPKLQLTAEDPSGYIRDRMELYGGGIGFPVTMLVINTGNLNQPPEVAETFKVTMASAANYQVTFTMGVDNPIGKRFPNRIQWRDQCGYAYKGPRCKYTGDKPNCDFTYFGANGCKAHNNERNYGGFLGLQNLQGA